ncbi:hypothetical protein C8Q74DRAFT_1400952 [Fomes fomentarius]|nr:hypothetical protein C8Q74DRAFT_1400952 [Fomes fomentarius]
MKNMENWLVQLFHDFDKMRNYFILSVMNDNLVPDRVVCIKATMHYLKLVGYLVGELIGGCPPHPMFNGHPIPSNIPAMKLGYRTWAQIHTGPYLVFLAELHSQPDLFIIVSHSITHHRDEEVEQFGGPLGKTYYDEATTPLGYLNLLHSGQRDEHYMFSHVQFPLRYLVIMDMTPNMDRQSLTTYTIWAAFCALGLVQGWEATPAALDQAAVKLMTLRMSKLFAWMPEDRRPDHQRALNVLIMALSHVVSSVTVPDPECRKGSPQGHSCSVFVRLEDFPIWCFSLLPPLKHHPFCLGLTPSKNALKSGQIMMISLMHP